VLARISSLKLEQKFSTGLGGIGPNLDVLLWSNGTPFAIESKFTEPYTKSRLKTYLKPKYFHSGRRLWAEATLPGCQAVAEMLRTGEHNFRVLDVAQLLKHMLALAHNFGSNWSLCCLWFEIEGAIAKQHRKDLTTFAAYTNNDAGKFFALTYQELFTRLASCADQDHAKYIAYLEGRYIRDQN